MKVGINLDKEINTELLEKYRISKEISLEESYIRIWYGEDHIFDADMDLWKFNPYWDGTLFDIGDVINMLADDEGIPDGYVVKRNMAFYGSELLRDLAEDVYGLAEGLYY